MKTFPIIFFFIISNHALPRAPRPALILKPTPNPTKHSTQKPFLMYTLITPTVAALKPAPKIPNNIAKFIKLIKADPKLYSLLCSMKIQKKITPIPSEHLANPKDQSELLDVKAPKVQKAESVVISRHRMRNMILTLKVFIVFSNEIYITISNLICFFLMPHYIVSSLY